MDRSSIIPNRFTTRKINDWMSILVWLDRMHILVRLISIENNRVISALFTIGNLLNMETETIKRRLWTKVLPELRFIGDLTFLSK